MDIDYDPRSRNAGYFIEFGNFTKAKLEADAQAGRTAFTNDLGIAIYKDNKRKTASVVSWADAVPLVVEAAKACPARKADLLRQLLEGQDATTP